MTLLSHLGGLLASDNPELLVKQHEMFLRRQVESYLSDKLRKNRLHNQRVLQSEILDISISENRLLTGWLAVTRQLNEEQCGIPKRKAIDAINASELAVFILATVFFLVRIVAKSMRLGGGWGMDDHTIIVAWVSRSTEFIYFKC